MHSERPKPLHRLCGRPMLMYVLDSLGRADAGRAAIVVGHKGDWVTKKMQEEAHDIDLEFVEQRVQRGTGDAAMVGLVGLPDDDDEGDVLVLPGDTPLLRPETIARAGRAPPLDRCRRHRADGPHGRPDRLRPGHPRRGRLGPRIVEQGDATDEERDDRRGQHVDLLLPPQPAGAGPAPRRARQRPGRVLPDRRGRGAVPGRLPVEAVVADDAVETPGVNDRAAARGRRGRAAASHQRGPAALRRHDARPDQHLRRHHRHGRPRRHAVPGRDPPGRHPDRRRHRARARTPGSSTARSAATA